MAGSVDFFYDLWSPHSYLASTQLAGLAQRTGATVVYRPYEHSVISKATGNPGPFPVEKKLNYVLGDIGRWVGHLGLKLTMPAFFPFDSNGLQRMLIATEANAGQAGLVKATDAGFAAVWGRGEDIRGADAQIALLNGLGLDGKAIVAEAGSDATAAKLSANSQAAIDAGAFGSPSFVVGKDLYWGNDRLDFVERAVR